MKYKKEIPDKESLNKELKACADVIAATDAHMLKLRERIESAEDVPTEDDILFDRLRKLDMPIG